MAENSKIEWTDHTFNPWMGCTKVSPACANCYAERDFDHRYKKVQWGPSGTRVLTSADNWKKPLRWNSEAMYRMIDHEDESNLGKDLSPYKRPRVFCASLADVFEDWDGPIGTHDGGRVMLNPDSQLMAIDADAKRTPSGSKFATMADIRLQLFDLIDRTPNLDWLLLTKRPENIMRMWPIPANGRDPGDSLYLRRDNVWLGTSVENQEYADKRIPELLKCRDLSPVLFLSCEPLLGKVDLTEFLTEEAGFALKWLYRNADGSPSSEINVEANGKEIKRVVIDPLPIGWVIAGGESGPNARPSDANWFRLLRDQCEAACVPFHFKQWGEFDDAQQRVGKNIAGRLLDGVTHDGLPVWGNKSCR